MKKYKTLKQALKEYPFTPEDLFDNREYDDFKHSDVGHSIYTYALEKGIDLDERKVQCLELLVDEEAIVIDEYRIKDELFSELFKTITKENDGMESTNIHFNKQNLETIEKFKTELQNLLEQEKENNSETLEFIIESFVEEFGCNYDFNAYYGVEILNSEHEDMRFIIEKFVESKCKTWDEYCAYLLRDFIRRIRRGKEWES